MRNCKQQHHNRLALLAGLSISTLLTTQTPLNAKDYTPITRLTENVSLRQDNHLRSNPKLIAANRLVRMEKQIIHKINQIRAKKRLSQLSYNPTLTGVARRHSYNMSKHRYFSHQDHLGQSVLQRVQRTGIPLRLVAENLSWTSNAKNPVNTAIQSWLDSPSHLKTLLDPRLQETGVGIARRGSEFYFTQVFIRKP